jgi:hypothetical protein
MSYNNIPDHILAEVLRFLDDDELLIARNVNQRFRDVCDLVEDDVQAQCERALALNSIQDSFMNTGYREGLEEKETELLQYGFNQGFAKGATSTFQLGYARGSATAALLFASLNSNSQKDDMEASCEAAASTEADASKPAAPPARTRRSRKAPIVIKGIDDEEFIQPMNSLSVSSPVQVPTHDVSSTPAQSTVSTDNTARHMSSSTASPGDTSIKSQITRYSPELSQLCAVLTALAKQLLLPVYRRTYRSVLPPLTDNEDIGSLLSSQAMAASARIVNGVNTDRAGIPFMRLSTQITTASDDDNRVNDGKSSGSGSQAVASISDADFPDSKAVSEWGIPQPLLRLAITRLSQLGCWRPQLPRSMAVAGKSTIEKHTVIAKEALQERVAKLASGDDVDDNTTPYVEEAVAFDDFM